MTRSTEIGERVWATSQCLVLGGEGEGLNQPKHTHMHSVLVPPFIAKTARK